MDWITDPQIWISLVTLTALEIVLGIDNIIFISILAGKLPVEQQAKARQPRTGARTRAGRAWVEWFMAQVSDRSRACL